jgi:peptide/nickel transport system substrate-binding protein
MYQNIIIASIYMQLKNFLKSIKDTKKADLTESINNLKPKQFILFAISIITAIACLLFIVIKINNSLMVEIPKKGGSVKEGIVGIPSFINPVLAISNADKDMTNLVYSGLLRKMPDGTLVPDIAESYEVSSDGLRYTFKIKEDLNFHDKKPITVDDIIFTIEKIKDPLIKSPRATQWDGIVISKINDNTVEFKLKQPFGNFLNNATVGILPMHLWKNLNSAQFPLSILNTKAVGSGPYYIKDITRNNDGTPKTYKMSRFKDFALGTPNIKKIEITSYANEKEVVSALNSGKIDQAGSIGPENAKKLSESKKYEITKTSLPRMFGLFFNQSKNSLFADKNIIKAIELAINKQEIIDEVLYGKGTAIDNPIPQSIYKTENKVVPDIEQALKLLERSGWKKDENGIMSKGGGTRTVTTTTRVNGRNVTRTNTVSDGPKTSLRFSIATGDDIELEQSASKLKNKLGEIGIEVEINKYEMGALNSLIRNRNYEVLFFGQVINNESDLYAFWHSSQISDPGLNIAMYSNSRIDNILERISKEADDSVKNNLYESFIAEFKKDATALFIYSPDYIYIHNKNLSNIEIPSITNSSNRFASIHNWYADTDRVWKIFSKKN